MDSLKIKIKHDEETRMVRLAAGSTEDMESVFQGVVSFAAASFGIQEDRVSVAYVDEEGDMVTMTGAEDMRDAVAEARRQQRIPKVHVHVQVVAGGNQDQLRARAQEKLEQQEGQEGESGQAVSAFLELMQDMGRDAQLKREVVTLANTWLGLVRQSGGRDCNAEQLRECVRMAIALSSKERLAQHRAMGQVEAQAGVVCEVLACNRWALDMLLMVDVDVVGGRGWSGRRGKGCRGGRRHWRAGRRGRGHGHGPWHGNRHGWFGPWWAQMGACVGQEDGTSKENAESSEVNLGEKREKEKKKEEEEKEKEESIAKEEEVTEQQETEFEFADALERLVGMGFGDVETLKLLLVSAHGSIETVLNDLL